MKLIVPHTGKPDGSDARLMRLAEFLGLTCEPLPLEKRAHGHAEYLDKAIHNGDICLVVNPRVMEEWTDGHFSPDLASCMASRIRHLLVHGLSPDPFCDGLIQALSAGRLESVRPLADPSLNYDIAPGTRDVCGHFSGISFGPVNPANDRILTVSPGDGAVRKPISIAGAAFMANLKRENAEMLFLASTDTFDVNQEVGDVPLSQYFSRFLPHVMALRYMFGEQCWHPCESCASFTIDDPLLRPKYGYLDFGSLLNLMKEYNFFTTVAFIPHNYRRNSKRTVQMFRQNGDRLAICFHGNDHTAGELGSTDTSRLNAMLGIAEARMDALTKATGLPCPKVMVFPQDMYSMEAMKVLKSHNFCAAVSGYDHPAGRQGPLTLGEKAQPAVLRHGKFPLFLRKFIGQIKKQDIAFDLFFGRPVLVMEHHGLFKQPKQLIENVLMINSIAPDIRWCDLETAVLNSTLRRRTLEGVCHIRAYSSVVQLENDSDLPQWFLVEWSHSTECPPIEQVLQGDTPVHSFDADDSTIRLSVELGPHCRQTFSVAFRNDYPSHDGLGRLWSAKAFLRRRLSEARDNYISKNRFAMAVSQALWSRIRSKEL